MPYFIALLAPRDTGEPSEALRAEHERFVEEMIASRVVLLGGDFAEAIEGASAAYVLRARSATEAQSWVARDPLVRSGAFTARLVGWRLVAIDPGAAEAEDLVRR